MTNAKRAVALGLAGALIAATASPTFARSGRTAAAAGIGFAAGALIGAAAANATAHGHYGGYAYAPDRTYVYASPSYGYAAYDPYVYASDPAYAYVPGYRSPGPNPASCAAGATPADC